MPLSRIFNVENMSFNTICEKRNSRENFQIYSIHRINFQYMYLNKFLIFVRVRAFLFPHLVKK